MQQSHRAAHARVWLVLALGLPLCLGLIFAAMPRLSPDAPAVRIAPPPVPETLP